jgi:hypothetical protein
MPGETEVTVVSARHSNSPNVLLQPAVAAMSHRHLLRRRDAAARVQYSHHHLLAAPSFGAQRIHGIDMENARRCGPDGYYCRNEQKH